MDRSETVAMDHLFFRGHSDVIYEPDGNVPPDFLVEGRIAVEVRRLGQVGLNSLPHKGLEESSIPLTVDFGRLLASYGTSVVTRLIDLSFQRPLPAWRLVDKGSRKFLDAVQAGILTEGMVAGSHRPGCLPAVGAQHAALLREYAHSARLG